MTRFTVAKRPHQKSKSSRSQKVIAQLHNNLHTLLTACRSVLLPSLEGNDVKYLLCLILAAASMAAQATPGNNGEGNGGCGVGQQTNGCGGGSPSTPPVYNGGAGGAGGSGLGVGVGIGVAGASAASNATSTSTSAAVAAQQQGQVQGQQQAQTATGIGGAGGDALAQGGTAVATGNGSGNKTSTAVVVDSHVERSAPAIAVSGGQPLPKGCRYVFGLGGSSVNGSVGASGIPLWKDSECTGSAFVDAAARFPGAFTMDDVRTAICENFDAAASTPTCKNRKQTARTAEAGDLPKPWLAGG